MIIWFQGDLSSILFIVYNDKSQKNGLLKAIFMLHTYPACVY